MTVIITALARKVGSLLLGLATFQCGTCMHNSPRNVSANANEVPGQRHHAPSDDSGGAGKQRFHF